MKAALLIITAFFTGVWLPRIARGHEAPTHAWLSIVLFWWLLFMVLFAGCATTETSASSPSEDSIICSPAKWSACTKRIPALCQEVGFSSHFDVVESSRYSCGADKCLWIGFRCLRRR